MTDARFTSAQRVGQPEGPVGRRFPRRPGEPDRPGHRPVQGAVPRTLRDSPYHGDYSICGEAWVSADSARIFTGCGTVFSLTEDPSTDLRYAGSLALTTTTPYPSWLVGLDTHVERDRIIAVQAQRYPGYWTTSEPATDQAVLHFGYRHLQQTGQQALPTYDFEGGRDRLHGRAVWLSGDGRTYYVVAAKGEGHAGGGYRTVALSYGF